MSDAISLRLTWSSISPEFCNSPRLVLTGADLTQQLFWTCFRDCCGWRRGNVSCPDRETCSPASSRTASDPSSWSRSSWRWSWWSLSEPPPWCRTLWTLQSCYCIPSDWDLDQHEETGISFLKTKKELNFISNFSTITTAGDPRREGAWGVRAEAEIRVEEC